MKTPQRLLEELLVRDINEADDYELEIVPTKYQSNLLDPHGKMGYFPVEKNPELPMILVSFFETLSTKNIEAVS
jgi:hypothetical protein